MHYIHELKEWPRFRWDHEHLAGQLAQIRFRQGRLIGRLEGLGFTLRDEAVLQTLTEDVLKTSEIEGEQLDRRQVRSSIARRMGMDIGGLIRSERDVDGVVEMMLDATQKFSEPLSVERLFGWHASLFPTRSLARIRVGGFRGDSDGPMQVVSGPLGRTRVHFQAPDAGRLKSEVRKFIVWFNGKDQIDSIIKAGVAHLWFVTIHPFDDGNGRIARALADMVLARSEESPRRFYSMSAQICSERKAYYNILESTQKGDLDITGWLEWFLGCLGRAFQGTETVLASVLTKAQFWEAHANEQFNERQKKIINRLLDGFEGKLTTSKWAVLGKCSQDTATRDIEDLVKRSILKKNTGGGRSTSYSWAAQES